MRRLHYILFLLIGVMVAPVLAQDTLTRLEPAACWMTLPDGVVEGQNLDCGYLIVPEDRSNTASPTG